jgi:hypothetical protein
MFFPGGPTMGQGSFQPWDMGALMQGSGMPGAQQAGAQQPQSLPMGVLQAMAPRQQPAQQPRDGAVPYGSQLNRQNTRGYLGR